MPDDMFGVGDIGDLIKRGVASVRSAIPDAIGDITKALGLSNESAGQQKEAAKLSEQGANEINKAQTEADLKRQIDDASSASALGNSPGAGSAWVTTTGAYLNNMRDSMFANMTKLEGMKGTGILDNPLEWMYNRFIGIPKTESQLQQQVTDAKDALGILHGVQDATAKATAENAAVDVANPVAKLAGLTKENAAKALMANAAANEQVSRTLASIAPIRMTAGMDQLTMALGINNAEQEIVKNGLQREQVDIMKTYRDQQTAANKLHMDEFERQLHATQTFESAMIPAVRALGVPITTEAEFNKLPQNAKDEIRSSMFYMNNDTWKGYPMAPPAPTPAGVLEKLQKVGSPGASPGMSLLVTQLNHFAQSAAVTKDKETGDVMPNPLFEKAPREVKLAMQDAAIEKQRELELKNIPQSGGIYSPQALSKVLELPGVKESGVGVISDLKVLATNPTYGTNPDDFMNTALKRAENLVKQDPKSASNDLDASAQAIAQTFKIQAADLNNVRQYSRLAIQPINQNIFPMQVHDASGKIQTINMADPNAVKNYLTKQMITRNMASELSSRGLKVGDPAQFLRQ